VVIIRIVDQLDRAGS